MIHPIYRDFLATRFPDSAWEDVIAGYLEPNRGVLESYGRFLSLGRHGWSEFVPAFKRRWYNADEEVTAFRRRLEGVDVEALARRGYEDTMRLLAPAREIDVFLIVGIDGSDGFSIMSGGEQVVGIGLECYGRVRNGIVVPFAEIPAMVAHEMCHVVRFREADTAMGRAQRRGEDFVTAMEHVPLHEWIVEEGLTVSTVGAVQPDLPLESLLLYHPEALAWCRQHEDELWARVRAEWTEPLTGERYTRYFVIPDGGLDLDNPPRTGYYLGYMLVQRYLREHPDITLADAVRLPAEAFHPNDSF
jgi:hypothetical protein